MTYRALPIEQRLMRSSTLDPTTGCIEWQLALTPDGYGRIQVNGKAERAHRVAWEQEHGPIPQGLCVLHRCDNPRCINVEHLFIGTQADNMADKVAKGRQARGEALPSAKLTSVAVVAIRTMHAKGYLTQAQLASLYGVSPKHIRNIVTGRRWAHLVQSHDFAGMAS